MAIINNAHAGSQINLLCLICRVIFRNNGKLTVDGITNLCRPDSLPETDGARKRFSENLNFWMKSPLRIWDLNEEGKLIVNFKVGTNDPTPDVIAKKVNESIFQTKLNSVFKENKYGIESFIRSLSIILASDRFVPYQWVCLDNPKMNDIFTQYFPDYSLNDSNEKPVFYEFCHFLGFFEPFLDGYFVDPTSAIEMFLPEIFKDKKKLASNEFLELLNAILPVFDNGTYRNQVEVEMQNQGWSKGDNQNQWSRSLSHALYRLERKKLIRLETLSDDKKSVLLGLKSGDRPISTIQINEEN